MMRSLLIASGALALVAAGSADAQQRPGASYGMPGRGPSQVRPIGPGPVVQHGGQVQGQVRGPDRGQVRGQRWGSRIGGRWWGGANAPGGWSAYRRPYRGYAVPSYWVSPRFYISDWAGYGLTRPNAGYNWARYYDDAVLIDGRGSVYDTVGGLDWDGGYRGGYDEAYADDSVYAGPDDRGYQRGGDDRGYRQRGDDRQRDSGVGGAVIGGVVGGVAGNVIAGRGNRLGGTLIGAGVGAAAGYAIDRSQDRGRRGVPPAYGASYGRGYAPPPVPAYGGGYAPPAVPVYRGPPGGSWVSPDGVTTVTTTSGGYAGYAGGSTTTVVVQSAPIVTTTTTEYYEDAAPRARPHRVWKKRWKGKMLPR
ncbi:RcnB family protein [Sphingomonas sp. R86521]|uniref:RcnB family protein n=1 Tax=Sphingomonas sp. R86521 TaxID=3093860 RepID=UPI0036D4244C